MKKTFSYAPNPFKKMPKGTKKLTVSNAVYIVDRDKNGKKINSSEFNKRIKETEAIFLKYFEGITHDEIDYSEFLNKTNGKIISERVARIMSFVDEKNFKKHNEALKDWLIKKKKEWNQELIAYEFKGDLYYF